VKYLSGPFVENLRAVFLYPGSRDSAPFRALLSKRYALAGQRLGPKTQSALIRMATEFYGTVYPPDVERDDDRVDFSDADIIKLYVRESQNLMRAKATLPEYVFLGRTESGVYNTLHRLKARVRTSAIVRRCLTQRAPAELGDHDA